MTADDVPDPSDDTWLKKKEKLMQLLRKVHAGVSAFRRSHAWNVANKSRALESWSQGCWAILALLEVLDALPQIQNDSHNELPKLLAKVKEAGDILRTLPLRTQVALFALFAVLPSCCGFRWLCVFVGAMYCCACSLSRSCCISRMHIFRVRARMCGV